MQNVGNMQYVTLHSSTSEKNQKNTIHSKEKF